ncbi:MAG: ATP-binding protein [Phycisphaerales bacterium]|nr:ATP-binding protein [Planctomycetota bacterium]
MTHPTLKPDAHIRVELLSNPTYTSGMKDLVHAVAKRLGFAELDCGHIALAVDEALCNIMTHGYEQRMDQPIWLSLWPLDPDGGKPGIKIVIEDRAKQIEPEKIRGRELQDVKPGGLGVHVIREVMDEVVYEKRDGGGMRLTMIKHSPAHCAGGPVVGGKGCHG